MAPDHPLKAYLRELGADMNPLPAIAGTYEGRGLIICADAACVWDDLERFGAAKMIGRGRVEKDGYDIMTVNRAVEIMPANIEHIYSNEPDLLEKFLASRRNEYRKEFDPPKHSHSHRRGAKHVWPLGGHGTSGLSAALVGVGLGYNEIVLCGMPLDNGPHNGEPPWRRCNFEREAADNVDTHINQYWERARRLAFGGRVKSMSGRTRTWLGEPDGVCKKDSEWAA
jgi:hypothetical protein